MSYSIIGILTVMVLLIINSHVLFHWGTDRFPAKRYYRRFLFSLIAYLVTDIIWGFLYENRLIVLTYIDTVLYFITMALSVLFWTMFVIRYLGLKTKFGTFLLYSGWILVFLQVIEMTVNVFVPLAFWFDADGVYHTSGARYAFLGLQVVMFLLTAVNTFVITSRTKGRNRYRYMTVGLFGLSMVVMVTGQMFFPLLPLYAIGCLLGGCVLHTFVMVDEKSAYLLALEEERVRNELKQQELNAAKTMVHTDALTGVKSKHAYIQATKRIDERIAKDQDYTFALAVFDLNGLKDINDSKGHEEGDRCIVATSRLISEIFCNSPVYRIGGDEFAVILEGSDYEDRELLKAGFERLMEENQLRGDIVVACGTASFHRGKDRSCSDVFARADDEMYRYKRLSKRRR